MEIIDVSSYATTKHTVNLECDKYLPGETDYRTDRGIMFTCGEDAFDRKIDFDPFQHLHDLVNKTGTTPINVLDSGCGEGWALRDLRDGVVRGEAEAKKYRGLGNDIHASGVTLSMHHSLAAEGWGMNALYVGPIEFCPFDRQYDFIYDYCGSAFYFPEEALSVYRRVLTPGAHAFVRLVTSRVFDKNTIETLIAHNDLVVLDSGDAEISTDYLLAKAA